MKTKLNFKKYRLTNGIMYPYRLELEGYNLRKIFFILGFRYGYAFSDTELGFEKSYEAGNVLKEIEKFINKYKHVCHL